MCSNHHCKQPLISDVRATRDQEFLFENSSKIGVFGGEKATTFGVFPDKNSIGHIVFDDEKETSHTAPNYENSSNSPVPDDEGTANARKKYEENPSYDNVMRLGDALSFQMRYREALECYKEAVKLRPASYIAHRKCAVRYLSTLQLNKAEEAFMWCDERATDKSDTRYMLGCCAYYKYEYLKALKLFKECMTLFSDGDMLVASVYWAIACSVQLGLKADDLVSEIDGIEIGHHEGYLKAVQLFTNPNLSEPTYDKKIKNAAELSANDIRGEYCDDEKNKCADETPISENICGFNDDEKSKYDTKKIQNDNLTLCNDRLQRCIYTYGEHLYYLYCKNYELSDLALEKTLANDTYFSAFAYLGAYTEYLKKLTQK